MKPQKFEFSNIHAAKNKVESLAADVAKIEANIIILERRYEEAGIDDGTSDPEAIYTKAESLRKELAIRRIEANRAAAKFAEAEEEFGNLVMSGAPQIADHLEAVARGEAEKIKKVLIPLFGEETVKKMEMAGYISMAHAVASSGGVARRIRQSLSFGSDAGPKPDLIANVLSAESLV